MQISSKYASISSSSFNLNFLFIIFLLFFRNYLHLRNVWLNKYNKILKNIFLTDMWFLNYNLKLLTLALVENIPYGKFSNGKSLPAGMWTKLLVILFSVSSCMWSSFENFFKNIPATAMRTIAVVIRSYAFASWTVTDCKKQKARS